jgi:hypothetical protein
MPYVVTGEQSWQLDLYLESPKDENNERTPGKIKYQDVEHTYLNWRTQQKLQRGPQAWILHLQAEISNFA